MNSVHAKNPGVVEWHLVPQSNGVRTAGDFRATREDVGRQLVFEGFNDQPNLIFGDNVTVQISGGVGVQFFVDFVFGSSVAVV